MNQQTAERWVTISAALVLGMYAYRRLTESPSDTATIKNVFGIGAPAPLGKFITAWGVVFLGISIMATAAPGLGGSFAILVAAADFLTNSQAVFTDVGVQQTKGLSASAAAAQMVGATSLIQTIPDTLPAAPPAAFVPPRNIGKFTAHP